MLKLLFGLVFALAFISSTVDEELRPIRILFVGNSLTYTNNLPKLVEHEAHDKKVSVKTDVLAFANYALEDHWNDGKLQQLIQSEDYDYIIVQQGPSSQADGREMLLNYGKKISALCERHKCRLVFFMVWPAIGNFQNFDGVIQNYADAAKETNSILCPVGKSWKEYIDKTNDYSYYGPDGFHPSLKGSMAAAQIISSVILAEP